jgi:hypothetical protein
LKRGWKPVRLKLGKDGKHPKGMAWQKKAVTEANVDSIFNSMNMNVGVQFGAVSKWLCDQDCDSAEAIELAPYFPPPTQSIYGRKSKPRAHYIYYITDPENVPPKAWFKHTDHTKECIGEFRFGGGGKGAQSVFPGSIHEESGELVEWAINGEPGRYDFATLAVAQRKLSLGCCLLKAWRESGAYHDTALALGGFLARARWLVDDIRYFVEAIAEHAGSDDSAARGKDAVDAAENFAKGENTWGLPKCGKFSARRLPTRSRVSLATAKRRTKPPSRTPAKPSRWKNSTRMRRIAVLFFDRRVIIGPRKVSTTICHRSRWSTPAAIR